MDLVYSFDDSISPKDSSAPAHIGTYALPAKRGWAAHIAGYALAVLVEVADPDGGVGSPVRGTSRSVALRLALYDGE
jgi:hypothetical protein